MNVRVEAFILMNLLHDVFDDEDAGLLTKQRVSQIVNHHIHEHIALRQLLLHGLERQSLVLNQIVFRPQLESQLVNFLFELKEPSEQQLVL